MTTNLRLALRLLTLRPGFCAAVVLTLAIGLGAATAIFSLVYALLLRPLPFPGADRLIIVDASVAGEAGHLTLREYRDLERDSRTVEGYAAYYRTQYNVTGGGPPEALTATIGSSTLFSLLGVTPAQGDVWTRAQDFTRQYLVVISHRLWQQRFGGRPDIAGQILTMDGAPYRVLGVMPDAFDYPLQTDVFRAATDYNAPHVRRYSVLARLRPGARLADAQAELDAFSTRFAQAYPDTNRGVALRATRLRDAYVGRARPFVLLLFGAVALLLLIASANVGNLLLSRAVGRRGDTAVRLALGATRGQLVRQSLTEALVLACAGALVGAVAARAALTGVTAMVMQDLPAWFVAGMDWPVLLFAALVTLVTAVAIGVAPALQAAGTDVERALRQDSTRTAGSRRQYRARRWLVAGQAAVAAVLLVAAGLFVSGLRELLRQDTGFHAESLMTFRVDPPYSRYGDVATIAELYRRMLERLATLPGVIGVGTNSQLPFSRQDDASPRVAVEGRSQGRGDEEPFVNFQLVDPGYFAAMRIRLRAGRLFDAHDSLAIAGGTGGTTRAANAPAASGASGSAATSGAVASTQPLVAVISERAAKRFWGHEDPLGKRLRLTWNNSGIAMGGGTELWLTVVGVVSNVRFRGMTDDVGLDVYATHRQIFAGDTYVVIRTDGAPALVRSQLAPAVRDVDPDQSIFDLRVMRERVDASIWQQRVARAVLVFFAAVALGLAIIGTYAVTAHAVAAQRRDIGIRLALGSSPAQVSWLVIRQWVAPVLAGTIAGAALGWLLARLLTGLIGLTGLTASGVIASVSLPAMLVAAATAACLVPVFRVTRRIQLSDVLRSQ